MNPFEFVVTLVLIGTIAKLVQTVLQTRAATRVTRDDPDMLRHRDEVRQLKERIQVLERVVTDTHGSRQLDTEIERLRDR